ncbi:putative CHA4-transcription factor [Rosellinia necatrix]|uniref:Putative CHA4-transcription factor n=1 Tax=Rosellinia necatrix TaxID=77044 RepID=A0A1W2TM02_ROSNE|nr:putative CHA4-transcription factor [Rosellinia necatrix]
MEPGHSLQPLPIREPAMNAPSPASGSGTTAVSCARCRRRKIKCDRREPCSKCRKADVECRRVGTGEKQRPTPKSYVQALEAQVASLETFIQKLASSDDAQRQQMLEEFSRVIAPTSAEGDEAEPAASAASGKLVAADGQQDEGERLSPSRAGQLRKTRSGSSAHFYGGTSLYHIRLSEAGSASSPVVVESTPDGEATTAGMTESVFGQTLWNAYPIQFAPHDDVSQRLMAEFFKHQYQYSMCIYREFFLRDYDTGGGRHYSDLLLFAICATGALATSESLLSDVFANQAEALLYPSLNYPDLTVLQALILLGQLDIGRGRASKGWLFCGMAFRLAHEMGLHLDPTNWNNTEDPDVEREILRRVYWAAFVVDKQLSLYFGRPPALYPQVSDVRGTERIPYPPDWANLLDTYIAPNTSVTAFEDGPSLVNALIYRIELYRIVHSMITEVFENRRTNAGGAVVAATITRIHVSLTKWLTSLPSNLHWNQWTMGQLPQWVYHLHLLFHTVMTILHRPPIQVLQQKARGAGAGAGVDRDDVETCYESLGAMLRLIRYYGRFYPYRHLPLDFVQTLSTAAGTVLMRRHLEGLPRDDAETARALDLVVGVMEDVRPAWPCVGEIADGVRRARLSEAAVLPDVDPVMDFDFLAAHHHHHHQPDDADGITWPSSFGSMMTGSMLPWGYVEPGEADFQ